MRLASFCVYAWLPLVWTSQTTWSSLPTIQSSTLVDVLGNDTDYTLLLHLLQRAKLIPTLNKLNGSTLFAPTNKAIERRASANALWQAALDDESDLYRDNRQEKLRQELFYHLLNYSVIGLPTEPDPEVHKTLLFPRKLEDAPGHEPPPSPPWLPVPGGTLGGEPQRLRVASRDGGAWVGVDAFGQGGAEIVKGKVEAGNGVLLGIGDVLHVPPDLSTVVSQHPSLSYFTKILTPAIASYLNSSSELTLFLPVDSAWDALHPIERLYLESEFATDDLYRILEMHAAAEKSVKWSNDFEPAINLTTLDGRKLEIVVSPEKTMISDASLVEPDIYASNGVLHTVSSLLVTPGALRLTPEKYLLALNCTSFVSLLHSVNLTAFINDTDTEYTILAPRDDVIGLFGDDDLPERGSEELKKLLEYHFISGRWSPSKLRDGMLLETALIEPGLDGGRQVLAIEVSDDRKKDEKKGGADRTVRFGGAGVIGDTIEVNNTLIYFVSRPLVPPVDPLQTALPKLDLSAFLAAVFATSLADTLKTIPRTTFLIPHNAAFERLGLLVSAHLLSSSARSDLEHVIQHHVLDSVQYAASVQNGSQRTFSTLEGSDIHLDRSKNGSLVVSASGGWAGMLSELYPQNALTSTGVIHEISDIMIPRSVNLTVGKLVKAAKGSTMTSMVVKAGMDWILNGTSPPEGSPWADLGLSGAGWTLLCPTDDSFKQYNLTALYADENQLKAIVSQHLIPTSSSSPSLAVFDVLNNNRPLVLEDSATYSTLLSPNTAYGDIVVRQMQGDSGNEYVLGIKGARGTGGEADWARVLSWGRSTTGGGAGGVVQIDRLLIPYQPPWWIEYGAPVVVGVIGVGIICLFFWGVNVYWRRDATEATYEPIGGFGHTEAAKTIAADNIKSFVAGGVGGVCAVLVGHPFDLTKTRLQTAASGTYTGALDVVRKTLARDGVGGLYRGIVPPLLGVTPIFAVSFWAYDASKRLVLSVTPNRTDKNLSTAELATAGFLSAIPTTLVTAPVERAKVVLQVQGQGKSGTQYKGVIDVMRGLYKEGGIRSIFRGSVATVARDGPGSAAYFAAYEVIKKTLTPAGASPSQLNLGVVVTAGGMAGVAMWAVAIPPDVIKSRMQSAPTGTYSGFLDCIRKTIAADGVAALWKGFVPAMARAFPANAATFLGVEYSRQLLDTLFYHSRMNESISVTRKPSKSKPYSASEIAKNPRLFEKWSTAHGCRDASWGDIPEDILDSVSSVFNTNGTIPHAWRSEVYRCLKMTAPLGLLTFLRKAHQDRPELFSNRVDATANRELLVGITMIFKAWQCLTTNKESWSEADYVANVHNTCRNAAVNASSYRAQTTLSLPQPLSLRVTARTVRVVNSTTIVPDNLLFLPKRLCHKLCSGSRSPFSRLRWDDAVVAISDTTSAERAFVYQATPCAQLPETERFEFVSSVSEDKKTVKEGKQEAYRQNRMATASVIRQLAAFGVEPVPIFGLVWENGTVQAHVDWYATQEGKPDVQAILSAPYIKDEAAGGDAHKWRLATPGDMLEVFVLIRNIDAWTVDGFYRRVARGVTAMADRVCSGARAFVPWRRAGELVPAPRRSAGAVVSGAGAHRTTVVRRDVVEESVATEGRTRTQRLSMESVEVVEDIPVPVAKASGKRNARATNAGLSRGKGKLALATVEEVAPKRPAGSKAAAGPSKKSDKPNARGPLQEKAKAPQLELSGRPRVQTRSRPYRQNALDAMVLRRSPRKRG
ncbi:hypothetical protein NEOLEDRAFT_1052891 [Neolentinus lepideus HHB14362 ss-1]|uniref:FAS1 domain-containing protein n=1 Tax=Neolentinus lepideus HHB14362 ss-1 TaxID=1314782 RepID=A0A165W5V3_9AGAM|nr:hypothetical protein NEOLEDRAFT_1052891 [Neolentinus lepideus HHB14362 ss-1]